MESTRALIRQLVNNPYVAQVCGITGDVPHEATFSRFFARLARHRHLVKDVFRRLVRQHYETIPVRGVPLWELLRKHDAPKEIDYLSMDIEGAEHLALKDFPFDEYRFRSLTIERNSAHYRLLRRLLRDNGYRLVANHCIDDFYVHRSLDYHLGVPAIFKTHVRRIAQDMYEREPTLRLRKIARGMRGRLRSRH